MIADGVMNECPELDRHGFCVGNIAPDCNIENEDWTSFTPSREITHWMSGDRKAAADSDAFCIEYIQKRGNAILPQEEYSFLLGYYSHLITDAAYQAFIRDDKRVRDAWGRIHADEKLRIRAMGYPEDWDSIKKLIPLNERMRLIYSMEAEYLRDNPASGYLTEILTLREFPDYIDYLPHGCIVRKIGVMGYLPEPDESLVNPAAMSRQEYNSFIDNTASLVARKLRERKLI